MPFGGIDIATNSGLAVDRDGLITATSFRPRVKRPFGLKPGEVDFDHEGQVAREFRDHLRAWLVAEEIEAVAIEKPLIPNITVRKPVIDRQTTFGGPAIRYEQSGATNFGTIFRIYSLVGQAVELCTRLNIDLHVVPQQTWRSSFLGVTRAPRGTDNGTAWLKAKAKERCEQLGIKIANADQADAAGICFWLRSQLAAPMARADLFHREAAPV